MHNTAFRGPSAQSRLPRLVLAPALFVALVAAQGTTFDLGSGNPRALGQQESGRGSVERAPDRAGWQLGLSGLVSDDFSSAVLDTSLWTVVDPRGDLVHRVTGTQVALDIDPAVDHDAWLGGIKTPRIRQAALDEDFEVEVKFDSEVAQTIQQQGILVEQDDTHFVRFEFNRHLGEEKAFAAWVDGESATIYHFEPLAIGAPSYMRVTRSGDEWSVLHSSDGINFASVTSFAVPIAVSGVSVYGGNSTGVAHTMIADYFFNTASPISPEDADPSALVVNTLGQGQVQRTPDQLHYSLDDMVGLLAVPDPGWSFAGWSGDVTGFQNPLALVLTSPTSVTASFAPGGGDCNGNGIDDLLDISEGTSLDCNGNFVPDECESDCDVDGIPDACEADCNSNGTPDDCEAFDDCNVNGIPDECDIASGSSPDLDMNDVPDECEGLGVRYCPALPNSTGMTGLMIVRGSTQVADDDLTLVAVHLPTSSNIGYFIMGTGMNSVTPPGAAGPICVSPGIKRFLPPVNNTNQLPGGFTRDVGTTGPISGQITVGSTWNFQAWHRDGMDPSNLTDAVSVTFN